ncbi:copper resistance-associated P-type ATPase [Rhizoctonia solani]|uniref:P-type Cu(+) transporter n=1 Tax=Rhizoctonia solani TaxID=456999 RepID=A0A8H8NMA1_9AGAM|nr:copper resistance-associated P-type ATPase [Rhizoctonia solani]QRW16309.1 copper resistance-associated P-type ATPase [Rhizoctonia solani]
MPTLSISSPANSLRSCQSFIQSLLGPISGIRDLRIDIDRRILSFSASSVDVDKEKLIDDVGQLLAQAGYTIDNKKDGEPSHVETSVPTREAHAKHLEHCDACRDDSLLDSVVVARDLTPLTLKTEFSIEGMTCASCTTSITNALQQHPGVLSVEVKLMLNSATVVHDGNACSAADIVSEIESIGFEASVNNSVPVEARGKIPKETVFGIVGMTCSSCAGPLSKAVQELEGVEIVSISLISNSMTVRYCCDKVTVEEITSVVEDCGFEVSQTITRELETEVSSDPSERTVQLEFQGMFCKECPTRIATHLSTIGIDMITRPSLASPIGSIRYTPNSKLTIRSILGNLPEPIIAKIYHPPSLHSIAMKLQAREARKIARLFLIATLFAVPTFVIGIVGMIALPKSHPLRQRIEKPVWGGAGLGVIVLWALATPVQFGVGWIFYKKSYASLFGGRRRQWQWKNLVHFGSMDLLVALSTTTAYFASVAMMAIDIRTSPHHAMEVEMRTYFDSSVFLIFFILAGRLLEGRAKTGDAISMLGAIRPETALLVSNVDDTPVLEEAGVRQVPVDVLELGDTILVQPGSIPPADGTIISGKTTVDESSLTGESRPVEKGPGDILVCGTTNLTSAVTVRVDKLGDATVLEKIVRAVADAQGRKAPIERLADRISGVFVPIVVWLSLVILAIWIGVSLGGALPEGSLPMGREGTGDRVFFAFEFTIAVLVVACPCGIGLAAPTAQAVGAGMAAKAGILAQGGGEAFQRASQVTAVVFDKTGTLTLGEPRVTDSKVFCEPKWLLTAVREMEMGSTHPIALALVRHCESEADGSEILQLVECEEKSGRGLVALVQVGSQSYSVLVGNTTLMRDHDVQVDESYVGEWQRQGKTVVFVAVGRPNLNAGSLNENMWGGYELAMCFAVADALRPESVSTVAELHKSGKQVWMLSGDNVITAKAVAHDLGIPDERVVAGVLPHEKADFITHLQSQPVVHSSRLPWMRREGRAVIAFCGDGLNDSAAIAAADIGIGLSHGSQITLSSSSFVLLSSSLSTLPFLLRLSSKVYLRQKLNFAWALIYNVAMIPVAAGAFYALGHTRLPPVWSALAMALSSVSVVYQPRLTLSEHPHHDPNRYPVESSRSNEQKGMEYFAKFLRPQVAATPKPARDHLGDFQMAWAEVKNTLLIPDERQLTRGIGSTNVPAHLQAMVDALVWESTRGDQESTGACLESLLKNDILGTLVSLSEADRPFGVQAEVLKTVGNLVVLMDEQFLVHAVVHKAVLRLLRVCIGDLIDETSFSSSKAMGAASVSQRTSVANYEEDLVDLLCTLCSRIRTYRELLMIFFHDKHWFQSQKSYSFDEEDEEETAEKEAEEEAANRPARSLMSTIPRAPSPASSVLTVTGNPPQAKPEYEFLLFNYLLRFVHREGKIGDLARAGLLFLLDVAMSISDHPGSSDDSEAGRPDPASDAALALAEYVLDGDFSDVLGAGLAAVYSVLPYKLEVQRDYAAESEAQNGGMLLGGHHVVSNEEEAARLEEAEERGRELNIGVSTSQEFRGRLDHFLKMAEFIQDVLKRNDASVYSRMGETGATDNNPEQTLDPSALVGTAISDAIIRAFKRVFLENVLYPSILECSDADGSAVAVLSYIETMLRTLKHGRLTDALVKYLVSEGTDYGRPTEISDSATRAVKKNRRKSSAMTLLEKEPANKRQSTYYSSLGRFTLKDFIFSNLNSEFSSSATASLKLLHCLLEQHCEMCTDQLLSVVGDPQATAFPEVMLPPPPTVETAEAPPLDSDSDEEFVYPGEEKAKHSPKVPPALTKLISGAIHRTITYATHERELGLYLSLVSRINPSNELDVFSTGYENYVRDALEIVQSEICYCRTLDGDSSYMSWKHKLQPNDSLLKLLLRSLRHFFVQTPEYNIALTGVLTAISCCPNRSMVGWLAFDAESQPPNSKAFQNPDDGDDRSIDSTESLELAPTFINPNDAETRPLERYRSRISGFDKHLTDRRQGLLFSENISDALNLDLSLDITSDWAPCSSPLPATPETPQRPKNRTGSSFMSFLSSKKVKSPTGSVAPEPTTPPRGGEPKVVPSTPFSSHYHNTSAIDLDGFAAAEPITGPWASDRKPSSVHVEDDVFTAWKDPESGEQVGSRDRDRKDKKRITLSQLLDNTVILEEFIKEMAGVIQARRSLGIDGVRIFD